MSVTSVILAASSIVNGAFSLGIALKKGAVPNGQQLVMTGLATSQVMITSRWPDGSAELATVSGIAAAAGTYAIDIGTPAGGSNVAETAANVQMAYVGTPKNLNTLTGTGEQYIAGPVMSAWIYKASMNAHITARFEVRIYVNGAIEFLAWAENTNANAAAKQAYTGDMVLTVTSVQRASTASVKLSTYTRMAAAVPQWVGATSSIYAIQNLEDLQQSKVVPAYMTGGVVQSKIDAMPSVFTPNMQGHFPGVMNEAGYQPTIGLLPECDAVFIKTGAKKAYDTVIAMALAGGRYPVHFRNNSDEFLNFAANPNLSADASTTNTMMESGTGDDAPIWKITHHPSIGFLAHVITGWRYFADEICFMAVTNHFYQTDNKRGFALGYFMSNTGMNTTRGVAWALRTLTQACMARPYGDSRYDQFQTAFDNNVNFWYDLSLVGPPQGWTPPYGDYTGPEDNVVYIATWQEDFTTAAMGMMLDYKPSSKMTALFGWKANSIVPRLGDGTGNNYDYHDAAPYNIAAWPSSDSNSAFLSGPYYSSWKQIHLDTLALATPNPPNVPGGLRGGNYGSATSYWGNMQPALAAAINHSIPGAVEGRARMTSAPNWNEFVASAYNEPVWSVVPYAESSGEVEEPEEPVQLLRTYTATTGLRTIYMGTAAPNVDPEDLPYELPEAGTWRSISQNTMLDVSGYAEFPTDGVINNWSGGRYAEDYSPHGGYICIGGGHVQAGSPMLQGSVVFDLSTGLWELKNQPLFPHFASDPNDPLIQNTNMFSDGSNGPFHFYDAFETAPASWGFGPKGAALSFLGGGGTFNGIQVFNLNEQTLGVTSPITNDMTPPLTGTYSFYNYGASTRDDTRQGFWVSNFVGNEMFFCSKTFQITHGFNAPVMGANMALTYMGAPYDALLATGDLNYTWAYKLAELTPGQMVENGFTNVTVRVQGTPPPDLRDGLVWSTILKKFICKSNDNTGNVYILTPPPPGQLKTGIWSWTMETLVSGDGTPIAYNVNNGNGVWSRFVEVPHLRAFIWHVKAAGAVQLFRLTGM